MLNSRSIPTYASKLTNELLETSGRELAKNTFDSSSFWLINKKLEVFYPGGGHTKDNVIVWLPKSRVLFGGCLVRSLEDKNLGYVDEASIEVWPESINRLLSRYKKAKIVVPGHGNVGNIELLEYTKKLAQSALIR